MQNKPIMPSEKRANSSAIPQLKSFVFRSKTFPVNDSLTHKRSNVQDNNDFTKQSFSSIPFIKLRGHFGNVFVKQSAVFVILTFILLFTAQKKSFRISFLLKCFV